MRGHHFRSEGFVPVDGAQLFYTARGAGRPLVLVHGGLASGATWAPIAAALAGEFLVLTPDSRGHGRSTNPGGVLSYSALADDVAALIAALGLREPVVAGWSDGGQIALELAVRHPAAVAALIVGGAYPEFDDSGLRAAHRDLLAEINADPDGPELAGLRALHDDWPALLEQTTGMWLQYRGLTDADVAGITQPTLVLAGDRDELVGPDLAAALFRALAHGELAVVPFADHPAPATAERGHVFADLIADFARRHGTTAAAGLRGRVATRLPAQDLERARRFYSDKLGLEPAEERPGGLLYHTLGGAFALFESRGSSPGTFTQMAWDVDDVEATVRVLSERGVVFEHVDAPGLRTVGGIADVEGNYPSKGGRGERAAWFRDSEGNLIGLGQAV